jgi:hypothetical protein
LRTQNSGSCSKSIGLQRLSRLLFPHLLLRQLLPVVAVLQRLVLVGLLLHYLLSKFSFTPSEDCLNPRLKHIVRLIVFSVRTSCTTTAGTAGRITSPGQSPNRGASLGPRSRTIMPCCMYFVNHGRPTTMLVASCNALSTWMDPCSDLQLVNLPHRWITKMCECDMQAAY